MESRLRWRHWLEWSGNFFVNDYIVSRIYFLNTEFSYFCWMKQVLGILMCLMTENGKKKKVLLEEIRGF